LDSIHSISIKGFGYIKQDKGAYTSWQDFISSELQKYLEEVKALNLLEKETCNHINKIFSLQDFNIENPCLLHGDPNLLNLIKNTSGELKIIDFGMALSGDPLYDLAVFEVFSWGQKNLINKPLSSSDHKRYYSYIILRSIRALRFAYYQKNEKDIAYYRKIIHESINALDL
jgi:thiamine kinase-like enzyme